MYHLIAINVNLVLCTTKRLEEKYQLIPNYWELNVSFNCHKWNSAFFRICTLNKCIFIQIFCISNTDFLYFNTDFCCLWCTIVITWKPLASLRLQWEYGERAFMEDSQYMQRTQFYDFMPFMYVNFLRLSTWIHL